MLRATGCWVLSGAASRQCCSSSTRSISSSSTCGAGRREGDEGAREGRRRSARGGGGSSRRRSERRGREGIGRGGGRVRRSNCTTTRSSMREGRGAREGEEATRKLAVGEAATGKLGVEGEATGKLRGGGDPPLSEDLNGAVQQGVGTAAKAAAVIVSWGWKGRGLQAAVMAVAAAVTNRTGLGRAGGRRLPSEGGRTARVLRNSRMDTPPNHCPNRRCNRPPGRSRSSSMSSGMRCHQRSSGPPRSHPISHRRTR